MYMMVFSYRIPVSLGACISSVSMGHVDGRMTHRKDHRGNSVCGNPAIALLG